MTPQEAVQASLRKITLAIEQSDQHYPNDDMNLSAALPLEEIARHGFRVEVFNTDDADALPCLVVQSDRGRLEIERCPFAPLALLHDDGNWTGTELVSILQDAGLTALRPDDFEGVPDWHGVSSIDWLFPERLSEALARFDTLRELRDSLGGSNQER